MASASASLKASKPKKTDLYYDASFVPEHVKEGYVKEMDTTPEEVEFRNSGLAKQAVATHAPSKVDGDATLLLNGHNRHSLKSEGTSSFFDAVEEIGKKYSGTPVVALSFKKPHPNSHETDGGVDSPDKLVAAARKQAKDAGYTKTPIVKKYMY